MTARTRWACCGAVALALVLATAAAGGSAAVPPLGAGTLLPPYDLGLGPSSAVVTGSLVLAYLLGALTVALGLLGRFTLPPRALLVAGGVAVLLCVLVPPLGSADHLSYTAYGRIAALGGDPYSIPPVSFAGGADPVTSAVQPPWQQTPSVYGPVATLLQALAALAGAGNLRTTVWGWQLVCAAAFAGTAYLLDRLTRHDPVARTRAAVLWTLNPLLLAEVVLGAHVDVLAVAFATAALALAARHPLPAGLALGAAMGTKITFGLFAVAILWGLGRALGTRGALRPAGLGVLGAVLVLVPAHAWSGPHTYDQLDSATRSISFATSWRLVADNLDSVVGADTVRAVAGPVALVLGALLAWLLALRLRPVPAAPTPADGVTAAAARAAAVLTFAWVLTAPYALPWYDAMVWAPLALLGPSRLDVAALARLGVLAVAYAPGRVVGLSADVERVTLGFRREVAPWLALAVTLAVVVWAWRTRVPAGTERHAVDQHPGAA